MKENNRPRRFRLQITGRWCLQLLLILFFPIVSHGAEFTESFSTRTYKSTSDLVWNTVTGQLHPPLQVLDYIDSTVTTRSVNFDVGDGRHGDFNSSTYANFSVGGDISGSIIRFDTNTYPILYAEDFTLSSGWTLQPVGDNPLIVYALGDVVIQGVINCSGDIGGDYIADAVSAASGGSGRCGGGDGGDGAYVGADAQAGEFLGTTIVGGGAGGVDGPSAGTAGAGRLTGAAGGGGGAYTESGGARDAVGGANGGGTGGSAGEVGQDHEFTVIGGGAGGGGGAAYTAGVAGQNASGGGGGGGGGAVIIQAVGDVEIHPGAGIYTNGGTGGGSSAGYLAGAGGGGGGGSILIYAGGEAYLSGNVDATEGNGGGNGSGAAGGKGAVGRTWVAGKSGFSIALPPNALVPEDPGTLMVDVGTIKYQTGNFLAVSTGIDTVNTHPKITGGTLTETITGAGSTALEVSSGTTTDFSPSVWENIGSVSENSERFLKFRVTINNTETANPTVVDAVQIQFTPFIQDNFEFAGGCGQISKHSSWPSTSYYLFLILIFMTPVLVTMALRRSASLTSRL